MAEKLATNASDPSVDGGDYRGYRVYLPGRPGSWSATAGRCASAAPIQRSAAGGSR